MTVHWTRIIRLAGRLSFLAILLSQAAVFSHYASLYCDNKNLYALLLLVLPAICVYFYFIQESDTKQLNWQWLVWLAYVIFLLVPMVCLLFRSDVTEKLNKNSSFGPNILKIITCGAPAIAMFLLATAKDFKKYDGKVEHLYAGIALDLLDALDLLQMLLHQDISSRFSSHFEASIIAFVCISFFVVAMEMGENEFKEDGMEVREKLYMLRLVLQMLLVNIPLLAIRLVVYKEYGHDASIFIAKNAIIIVTSAMEVIRVFIHV